ncbi:MFS general substrate transporter [Acrodontium crateriforme]|uniref:MFS general substrate transporter n=1 Tax=Acrodontium crateriforme TaxID=150365 RepID=A0AAQ3MAP4_9PEZI|nr:MFS general substrate transporter [Acrodontium crateriforme]
MSLVQHVTSIEGFDRELPPDWLPPLSQQSTVQSSGQPFAPNGYGTLDGQTGSPAQWRSGRLSIGHGSMRSLKRVISYDALKKPEETALLHPHIGLAAYKVSTAKRIVQVLFTVLSCWLASGIVFGFAAIKPVMISEGVYRELCTAEELNAGVELCYEQDLRLNLFFAAASTTCNVSALPVGTILDRYGPRVASIIGSCFLAIGSVLMACAFAIPEFDGYLLGNVALALGGTFIFVPSFSIANAFPKFSGIIVAIVTGAFDASAAVFLLYRLVYEETSGAFTPKKFFLIYLVVPIFIIIAQVILMTPDGYKTIPQLEEKLDKVEDVTRDVHASDDELSDREVRRRRSHRQGRRESKLRDLDKLLGDAEFRQERQTRDEERLATSGVWGALHGKSALEQMLSPWFYLLTILTCTIMVKMNWQIATISLQYEYMLGSELAARRINTFFDFALPIGGVAATPFIGLVLDNFSTANMLAILVFMISAVGVLSTVPFAWAAYCNVALFVLLRPFYYSAMSDYATKVFGFATFGRVYGSIIFISGMVNLVQPAISAANHDLFNDNPIPINAILAVLSLTFGTALVIYVWVQTRRQMKQMAKWEASKRQNYVPSILEDESEYDFN